MLSKYYRFITFAITPIGRKRFSQVVPFEKFSKRWQDNDLGTDVIAVTGGDVWAIQCKCYAPHNKVNKVEVDSFIADSSRSIVKKRLSDDHRQFRS